ncbi:MAG: tRNA preQ1(34) S-adenosylmethionine ribosyltransferase-isomerase QueA [Succinivibrionaceae bacterium]
MLRSDFNFNLPKELIAQFPAKERTHSRLLCLDGNNGNLEEKHFYDIIDFLEPGDLLVFNNTKVLPARLYGKKETGGNFEILVERVISDKDALVHIKCSRSPKSGSKLLFPNGYEAIMKERKDELFVIEFVSDKDVFAILNDIGHIPLPPYIERQDLIEDRDRYQTVYSKVLGAVAAPTAGLHFSEELLKKLKDKGIQEAFVTLHVGAGTFKPVKEDNILDHKMHSEYVEVTQDVVDKILQAKAKGHRVIAVGTTSVRSLESAAQKALESNSKNIIEPYSSDTSIFIYPGYKYLVIDCLITNFHLPESTLIMLVSAFAGYRHTMNAYRYAVENKFRFFSYGDAMFITKNSNPESAKDIEKLVEE